MQTSVWKIAGLPLASTTRQQPNKQWLAAQVSTCDWNQRQSLATQLCLNQNRQATVVHASTADSTVADSAAAGMEVISVHALQQLAQAALQGLGYTAAEAAVMADVSY